MAFSLETVVPWGLSFDEYRRMFSLADADLQKRILGCADGPASFNVELTETDGTVISADSLYRCSADEIRQRRCLSVRKAIESPLKRWITSSSGEETR